MDHHNNAYLTRIFKRYRICYFAPQSFWWSNEGQYVAETIIEAPWAGPDKTRWRQGVNVARLGISIKGLGFSTKGR